MFKRIVISLIVATTSVAAILPFAEPAAADTVCPASMPLGELGSGVAAQDAATGSGYLLWSSEPVHTRFTPAPFPTNADHLIAVKYVDGQWLVDNNYVYTPFTPTADDCLVAALDFDANTATTLEETSAVINGIDSGYVTGDLVVTPEQWNGVTNAGEFDITGTLIGDEGPPPPGTLTAVVNPGTVSETGGAGAAILTVTRSDVTADPVTVTVTSSDTTEAAIGSELTIPGDQASATIPVDAVDDTDVDGPQTVTLTATAAGYDTTSTTITVTDNDVPPPDTVCPASMPLGELGSGVAAQDAATGSGYLLWSSEPVHTRFTPAPYPTNADHLIAVKYVDGQWLVDNNYVYTPFTPTADDCLVAALDFDANTATTLEETSAVINGIDSGYVTGDLVVTPEQWNGFTNAGEFDITGTLIGDEGPPPPGTLTAVVNPGTVSETGGAGAATLTVTRSDVTADPVTVTVTSSDTTEAAIGSELTIPGDQASATIPVDAVDDTDVDGPQTVTLTATAAGYDTTSTTITVTDNDVPPPDTVCPASMPLGELGSGVAAQDAATGSGYLLWSSEPVHTRFTPAPYPTNADHLIAVKYVDGQWLVDNNYVYTPFTPTADDCLVAALDFDANTATTLEETSAVINGIDSGYVTGDLVVTPEQWNGFTNAGEFDITGTLIGDEGPPPPGTLTAVVNPGTVSETGGAGAAILTVTRSDVTADPVTVTVTSSDTTEAAIGSELTIPGDQASATIPVDAVDDTDVDGPQTVTLTATAAGYDTTSTTITVTDNDVPPPDTVCPASMPLGELGSGVAAQDAATGSGYLLWSSEPVHTRFTPAPYPTNADHLIAVKYSDGQWLVDNNYVYTPFTPTADDCLVAALDFDANTATTLEETSAVINGIDSGYVTGDLVVTPEQWNGFTNAGEFDITGTLIGDEGPPPPGTLTAVVNPGTVSETGGAGAAILTVTRSDVTADPVTVTVTSSDTTEAAIGSELTIPGDQASATIPVDAVDDTDVDGPQTVTLTATAAGYDTTSTTITVTDNDVPPPDTVCPASMPLGELGSGVAAQDAATGSGYLLWSSEPVHTRFTPAPFPTNADHLIAVKYSDGQWLVDNNYVYTPFTPTADDCLVAALDFDANTATTLEETSAVINGIDSGYVTGDLVVTPEQWNGFTNAGEFGITGTLIG